MNAIPAPGRPSRSGNKPQAARCVSVCLAASLYLTSAQGAAQEPVAAVWQSRKLSFSYSSATTVFSCSALASRVASILRALGARDDLKVKATGCSESITPPPSPVNPGGVNSRREVSDPFRDQGTYGHQVVSVYVKMMLPTEVTPDVLAELKKDKSRRELVSRVTGNPAARFNDPILFGAQWEPVTLSRKTIGIEAEECELLEQMSPGVFRDLGMRVVRSGVMCSPDSRIPPEMVVEALRPTPFERGTAPPAPPDTEDDADRSAPATSNDDGGKDAEADQAKE